MKTLIIVIMTAVITFFGAMAVWYGRSLDKTSDQSTPVRVERPTRGDLVEIVSASGTIEPKRKVSISARVCALILDLPNREGQQVTAGDGTGAASKPSVLVRLDDKDLQAALRTSQSRRDAEAASLEVAKARLLTAKSAVQGIQTNLDDALRNLAREKELLLKNISSQSTVDTAQCLADKLQSDLEAARHTLAADEKSLDVNRHNLAATEAEVVRCRDNLAYTTITSPIDGVVTRVKAEVGEMAMTGTMNNPGTEILQVADLSTMLMLAEVDEAYIGGISPGQKARIRISAYPGRVFEGTVESVAMVRSVTLRTGSQYFETRILVDTGGQRNPSGLTADVDIETHCHACALKVPSQAVLGRKVDDIPSAIRDNNPNVPAGKTEVPVVYRLVNGKAVITPVKIGAADATSTVITAGLSDDDQVIVGPYKALESLHHDQAVKDDRAGAASRASTPASTSTTAPAATTQK